MVVLLNHSTQRGRKMLIGIVKLASVRVVRLSIANAEVSRTERGGNERE